MGICNHHSLMASSTVDKLHLMRRFKNCCCLGFSDCYLSRLNWLQMPHLEVPSLSTVPVIIWACVSRSDVGKPMCKLIDADVSANRM